MESRNGRRGTRRNAGLLFLVAVGLIVGGCGSSSDTDSGSTQADTQTKAQSSKSSSNRVVFRLAPRGLTPKQAVRRAGDTAQVSNIVVTCFIAVPQPPSRSGSSISSFGGVGCVAPVTLGIRVCVARSGVKIGCSPGAASYQYTYSAYTSGRVSIPGCSVGASYATIVDVEARASNVFRNSKISLARRLC